MTEQEDKIAVVEKAEPVEEITKQTMEKIIQYLVGNGRLLTIGLGGHGKSNAVMHIVRFLMNTEDYKNGKILIRITDSANTWKMRFDKIPFIDVTKKASIPDNEKTLLIDLGFLSTSRNVAIVENLVGSDFHLQRELMDKNNGYSPIKIFYIFEEVQNLFGSNKKSEFWLKMFSESRNTSQYILGLGQRLADITTRIVERCKYMLIGGLSGENDLQKIRRAFGKETGARVISEIQSLKQSEFLLINREQPEESVKIYFPQFKQNGVPYLYDEKGNGHIKVTRVFL